MGFAQFKIKLNIKLARLNQKISRFFALITNKLKNFKNLRLGEQVAFGIIGLGLLLILVSIVLFIF